MILISILGSLTWRLLITLHLPLIYIVSVNRFLPSLLASLMENNWLLDTLGMCTFQNFLFWLMWCIYLISISIWSPFPNWLIPCIISLYSWLINVWYRKSPPRGWLVQLMLKLVCTNSSQPLAITIIHPLLYSIPPIMSILVIKYSLIYGTAD